MKESIFRRHQHEIAEVEQVKHLQEEYWNTETNLVDYQIMKYAHALECSTYCRVKLLLSLYPIII